jgi:hypothetical protein
MYTGEQYTKTQLSFLEILLFLLSPKYNVFRSKILQNEYNINYIHVFFQNLLKHPNLKFQMFKNEYPTKFEISNDHKWKTN